MMFWLSAVSAILIIALLVWLLWAYFIGNPLRIVFMNVNPNVTRQEILSSSKKIDLNKYVGVWETIATLRATGFQQACRQKTRVEYQLQENGSGLVVKNACEAFVFGDFVQEVSAISKSENNRILLVGAYSGDTEGNYVIYDFSQETVQAKNNLDDSDYSLEGYKWVIVGDGALGEAWLMVRNPKEGTAIFLETREILQELDLYDKLLLEPQPTADYMIGNNIEKTRNALVKDYLDSL